MAAGYLQRVSDRMTPVAMKTFQNLDLEAPSEAKILHSERKGDAKPASGQSQDACLHIGFRANGVGLHLECQGTSQGLHLTTGTMRASVVTL